MTIACKWKAVDYAAAAAVSEQVNFRTACERQEWVTWTTVMIMEKKHDRKIYARPRIYYIECVSWFWPNMVTGLIVLRTAGNIGRFMEILK